jgi:epoxyqueuosine reductase QueG
MKKTFVNERKELLDREIVKEYGLNAGASVVGIAASKDFGLAPEGFKPSDNLEGCLSVIVLGAPFSKEALITMSTVEYTEIRNAILSRMTSMAKEVEKRIKKDGHKAKAISAIGGKYIEGKHYGYISLKHAAELAGLGLINRNYLLTNPQYGNLLWFSAVLTDADLVPDEKAQYKICDNCNKCVETCPTGALDNPALFGNKKCDKFYKIVDRKLEIQCFSCRKVCPNRFGK